jgi:DNA-binding NarL/FixJ family response regulator
MAYAGVSAAGFTHTRLWCVYVLGVLCADEHNLRYTADGPRDEGSMTLRVILGEDGFLAREAIRSVLEGTEGVDLVGACRDLGSLRAAIARRRPDVVVTDIHLPPGNSGEGIRLAVELRKADPVVGVVVLSQHADPSYATLLFEQGSDRRAYLLKESLRDKAELTRALYTVANGGSVVDPAVVEQLVAARRQRAQAPLEALTPRELEILAMIAEGRSNAAIADELVVTKRAVERHINGIFLKLNLRNARDVDRRVKAVLLYLAGDEHVIRSG